MRAMPPQRSNEEIVNAYLRAYVDDDAAGDGRPAPPGLDRRLPAVGRADPGPCQRARHRRQLPGRPPEIAPDQVVGSEDHWVVSPSFTYERIVGSGDAWFVRGKALYPDGSTWHVASIYRLRDGLIVHEITYWAEPFEPPAWRARVGRARSRQRPARPTHVECPSSDATDAVADRGDPRHPCPVNLPARDPADSLWRADRRALTTGLVLTVTLIGFEALAISTVMPIVSNELGGIELYGWVFSAFFLGSLIGIVVVGGAIDRGGLAVPYGVGLALFAIGLLVGGLAPSMLVLVAARFVQGLGAGTLQPIAYVAIGRTLPEALRPRMFATLSTAWVLPGVIGPAIAGSVGEHIGWRFVFLGLLPLIALAGALTLGALRAVAPAPVRTDDAGRRRTSRPAAPGARRRPRGRAADGRPDDRRTGPDRGPERRSAWSSWSFALRRLTPAGTLRRATGPAGRRPAARHPDLRLLRRRRVRRADPGRLARRSRPPKRASP